MIRKCFIIFLFTFFCGGANAEIVLDRMVVDIFPKDQRQQNVSVYNRGDEKAYVSTAVFEIRNPGFENESRIPVDLKEKNRLIVVPNKLTIDAAGEKRVQFVVNDGSLTQDRIYRVEIKPEISGIEVESGIGVKILVGYDVLVVVRPDKPVFDLKVLRDNDTITFENRGNTNILLANVKQCLTKDNCTTILSKRLYAGNRFKADLIHKDRPVIADILYGNEAKTEKY